MGMYTGLRCRVELKAEWIPVWDQLINQNKGWEELRVNSLITKHLINEWNKVSRSSFVPFGSLTYMPDSWNEEDTTIWARQLKGNVLQFQCSLKSYETIMIFFNTLLNHMVIKIHHLEVFYEENEEGSLYDLVDGKIINTGNKTSYEDPINNLRW